MFKKLAFLLIGICGATLFTGCETTGDPHTGGIFWSEDKAKQRLADRQATLDSVQSDTAHVNRSNQQLQGAAARRQQMLDSQ